ncbi:uncharacterized protein FIBRA_05803 [Fibroporia radiculosa]|uniref:Mitochondrial inner membrane protease ATP23 n=1 Tax=Fibroporia radiculosa TaxID=599839 RepID=J4H3Q6_9APHY|nr:uncharacterized protein FIBRA_05803 [Fibroporia radiculosa]CCM03659.1 predicted protein [Fibroporia radiculosa]
MSSGVPDSGPLSAGSSNDDESAFEQWRRTFSVITGLGGTAQERQAEMERLQGQTCEKWKRELMNYSPAVVFMLKHLRLSGCVVSSKDIVCVPCDYSRAGGFNPDAGAITLCQGRFFSKNHMEDTLVHELVHMYDHAKFNVNWRNLRHHACSEIRASSLSGDCRWTRELRRGFVSFSKQHQACVRRRAILSVSANTACPDEATAERVVNEVWESCFNDTRPFDEVNCFSQGPANENATFRPLVRRCPVFLSPSFPRLSSIRRPPPSFKMFAKISALATLAAFASAATAQITLQTPTNWQSGTSANISWTATDSASLFSLELVNSVFHNAFAIAGNIQPSLGFLSFEMPSVPPGAGYVLEAVNVTNINDVYGSSGSFSIAQTPSTTTSSTTSSSSSTTSSLSTTGSTTTTGSSSSSSSSTTSAATTTSSAPATTNFNGSPAKFDLSLGSWAVMAAGAVAGAFVAL